MGNVPGRTLLLRLQPNLLPKWLCFPSSCMTSELKQEPKYLVVAGAARRICFRPSSPGTGTQKGREVHSNPAYLAIDSTTSSLCIQDTIFHMWLVAWLPPWAPAKYITALLNTRALIRVPQSCFCHHQSNIQGFPSISNVSNPSLLCKCPIATQYETRNTCQRSMMSNCPCKPLSAPQHFSPPVKPLMCPFPAMSNGAFLEPKTALKVFFTCKLRAFFASYHFYS